MVLGYKSKMSTYLKVLEHLHRLFGVLLDKGMLDSCCFAPLREARKPAWRGRTSWRAFKMTEQGYVKPATLLAIFKLQDEGNLRSSSDGKGGGS